MTLFDDVSIESISQILLSSNSCILHIEDFEELGLSPEELVAELDEYIYHTSYGRYFEIDYYCLHGGDYLYKVTFD